MKDEGTGGNPSSDRTDHDEMTPPVPNNNEIVQSSEVEEAKDWRRDESRDSRNDAITTFKQKSINGHLHDDPCSTEKFIIHPKNRIYRLWFFFIVAWAVYSTFFTPLEFGFFRGLPDHLIFLDIAGQFAFIIDIVVQFFVAYRDGRTYLMITNHSSIAVRYLKGIFILDVLACFPWDSIYKACGNKEEIRYFLWIRLVRVRKIEAFLQKMERDTRINYMFTRILKLIIVELYCTHTAACLFYYLATTIPASMEERTWIGSLKLGDFSYSNFREIDLLKRYLTSLYFAIITMATVGYGDIHAVNVREMIFIMIFVSFDMILGAYLIGNMTALIVRGSKTENFRDKMTDLIKYMNRNRLGKEIRNQIKGHVQLQYESSYKDASVLHDLPVSIRAKVSECLYKPHIENVPLLQNCSAEFINQIATRLHEEFFLPGEVILEQANAVDQLYFVCHGVLEGVSIGVDGSEEIVFQLNSHCSFGDIAILCNIPQPYTIRVCALARLLRLDKQTFTNILEIYFYDGRTVFTNLLQSKESQTTNKKIESDIALHIAKQEAELALKVNNAAYDGDLRHLKGLVRAGADPNKMDYDGRTPLHLAASKGYVDLVHYLLKVGAKIDKTDRFGCTPLLEAINNGHDRVVDLLANEGASLHIDDVGSRLCMAVARGDSDFLKRVLCHGVDANVRDYDHRTPLHIASSGGLYMMAKLLLDFGASVLQEDRWGRTPLDEARRCGSRPLVQLLEKAKSSEQLEFPSTLEYQDKMHPKKCTVFSFLPWEEHERRAGVVVWVPRTIEELVNESTSHLKCSGSCILSEDGGKILDTNMISDGQKLYLSHNQ